MKVKNIWCVIGTVAALSASALSAEGWMTDFEAAKKKAAVENKSLLVDFTGSDWCHWCIQLDDEVFKKPEFKGADDFILVSLDFPRDESKQTDEVRRQNAKLQKYYKVEGFPTILIMDSDGRPYARTGYKEGGPEAYNKHLAELKTLLKVRDDAFAAADELDSGKKKAEAYITALKSLNGVSPTTYPSILEKILESDPKNKFAGEVLILSKLASASNKEEVAAASKQIDEFISLHNFEGEEKQQYLTLKFELVINNGMIIESAPLLDAAIAVAPDSELGKEAAKFRNTSFAAMLDAAKNDKTVKETTVTTE